MRLKALFISLAAFATAGGLALLMAIVVGGALEARSARHVTRALTAHNLTWVNASADGLIVTLTGTAPSEALRFRASTVAAGVVGSGRVIDRLEVTPAKALTAPRFSLEFLRNGDGISMIGLVPSSWDTDSILAAATQLAPEDSLTNMLETADFPVPEAWDEAVEFGLVALRLLPRSRISLAVDAVKVTAISDSPAQKRRFESDLAKALPDGIPVQIEISAPRPVIAPFTLRFVMDADGPRFDACAADSERSRARIAAAARGAGLQGTPACTLGLGAPSPRWAEAAEAAITALGKLGAGSVTISDVDITLIAEHTVPQETFDQVTGTLTSALPDVFSLKATLNTPPESDARDTPMQFIATLSEDRRLQLRGGLTDERMRNTVEAFAHARFGSASTQSATRLDDALPPRWGTRVLSGLSALSQLHSGLVVVSPARVMVRGTTGNPEARSEISRLLSERLGQGASFSVDVSYIEKLDPNRALPTPDQCLTRASSVLAERQISFAPGSTDITGDSIAVIVALVEALEDCRAVPLEIGGHTDSQGRAETNLRLSQKRAESVLAALKDRGADVSAMEARGYGAEEPIADNKTEAGRLINRRIALKLIGAAPAAAPAEPAAPVPEPEDHGDGPMMDGDEAPMGEAGDLEVDADGNPVMPDDSEAAPVLDADNPDQTNADQAGTQAEPDSDVDWQPDAEAVKLRPLPRPEGSSE